MSDDFWAWELHTRAALAKRNVGHRRADVVITEAEAYCTESSDSPFEVFGAPDAFADQVAVALPPEVRPGEDAKGYTPRDYVGGSFMQVAGFAILGSLVAAVSMRSLSWTGNPARIASLALVAAAFVSLSGIARAIRSVGYPRLAKASYALSAGLAGAGVWAYVSLPTTPEFSVPHLAVAGAALALIVAMLWNGDERPEPTDDEAATLRGLVHRALASSNSDPERWFRALHGLLVGQHEVPPPRATELVEEARAHLADTGTTPEDEFGLASQYAATLAAPIVARKRPWYRSHLGMAIALFAGVAVSIGLLVNDIVTRAWIQGGLHILVLLAAGWGLARVTRSWYLDRHGRLPAKQPHPSKV
ncbi:hypothetical protein ABZ532_31170 [Streptomyces sp. NPDC019396]|uniref:hypothetical protein n=1 Tax=Streptomyces sp. NPDC019396 TaxID=3154687 RepID=UPI00340C9C19